jgi:hypothetical protein
MARFLKGMQFLLGCHQESEYRLLTNYLTTNKHFQKAALNVHENVECLKEYTTMEWHNITGMSSKTKMLPQSKE